jgi:Uma2 family endonuclease
MERKLKLYMESGVREYWVVNPENKALTVYHFQRGSSPSRLELVREDNPIFVNMYGSADTVPVDVLPGLDIALEQVFAE